MQDWNLWHRYISFYKIWIYVGMLKVKMVNMKLKFIIGFSFIPQKKNSAESCSKLCAVDVMAKSTMFKWFSRFKTILIWMTEYDPAGLQSLMIRQSKWGLKVIMGHCRDTSHISYECCKPFKNTWIQNTFCMTNIKPLTIKKNPFRHESRKKAKNYVLIKKYWI